MARKKKARKTPTRKGKKGRGTKKVSTAAKGKKGRSSTEYDFMFTWTKFQEDLGKQISEVIETQQQFHKDLNRNWADISSNLTDGMSKALPSDESQEDLQRMWGRYLKEMNRNLESYLVSETKVFDTLHEKWKPLSEEMGKAVMALGTSKDIPGAQEKVLTSWIEISQVMTEQMAKSIETGNEEFKGMRTTWSNLMADMERSTRKLQETNPEMADSFQSWNETSKKINKVFLTQMDTDLEELTRRQNFWLHIMSDMNTGFVKAIWETNLKMYDVGQKGASKRGGT